MANKFSAGEFTGTFWTVFDGDFYVSTTGNDLSGTGSPTNPFLTVAKAFDLAVNGEKIVIGPFEYVAYDTLNAGGSGGGAGFPCRFATTGNISLPQGTPFIEGNQLNEGDRILVWQQSGPAQNGIYVVTSNGSWERDANFNSTDNIEGGTLIPILQGTHAKSIFQLTTTDPITVGSTYLTFEEVAVTDWGEIGGTLTNQTDLNDALGLKADQSALDAHTGDTSNPHNVTKSQVGLGNAENTADADKPVSTAQQTALDLKADITYVDGAISTLTATLDKATPKGTIDASTNPGYPAGDLGDYYYVTDAGTIGGDEVQVGDKVQCIADTVAGQNANWIIFQGNLDIAQNTEMEARTNADKYVTPATSYHGWYHWLNNENVTELTTTDKTIVGAINEAANSGYNGYYEVNSGSSNTSQKIAEFNRTSSPVTADNGIGGFISIGVENSTGAIAALSIEHILNDSTAGSEDSIFRITGVQSGAGITFLEIGSAGTGGTFNTQIGASAVAGISSFAGGRNATASGSTSVAIGVSSTSSAGSSVAIGSTSTASGSYAVAIGNSSTASFGNGIALGRLAQSGAADAIAIGTQAGNNSASLDGVASISIGNQANRGDIGINSIGIGISTVSSGDDSISIGKDSLSTSGQSIAIGLGAEAENTDAIAIGTNAGNTTGTKGLQSINIGPSAGTFGNIGHGSIAIGQGAEATESYSVGIGRFVDAKGTNAIAIGRSALVSATGAIALGYLNSSTAQGAIIMGFHSALQTNSLSDSFKLMWDGSTGFHVGLTLGTQVTVNPDPDLNLTDAANGSIAYDSTDHEFRAFVNGAWQGLGSGGGLANLIDSGANVINSGTGTGYFQWGSLKIEQGMIVSDEPLGSRDELVMGGGNTILRARGNNLQLISDIGKVIVTGGTNTGDDISLTAHGVILKALSDPLELISSVINLGDSTTLGTERSVNALGSDSNISIGLIPKGTGTIKVPTGYESNISDPEDLVNRAYVDSVIGGGIANLIDSGANVTNSGTGTGYFQWGNVQLDGQTVNNPVGGLRLNSQNTNILNLQTSNATFDVAPVYIKTALTINQGGLFLGATNASPTSVGITAQSTIANVPINLIPKGTGTIKVPTGYESNISDAEDLVNRAYVDSIIGGGIANLIDSGANVTNSGTGTGYFQWDNIRIDSNNISAPNTNQSINLVPNGTGVIGLSGPVSVSGNVYATSDKGMDIGITAGGSVIANRIGSIYSGYIESQKLNLRAQDNTVIPLSFETLEGSSFIMGDPGNSVYSALIEGKVISGGGNSLIFGYRTGTYSSLVRPAMQWSVYKTNAVGPLTSGELYAWYNYQTKLTSLDALGNWDFQGNDINNVGTGTANTNWVIASDERLKNQLDTLPDALSIVRNLQGHRFKRNDLNDDVTRIGFMAQEVNDHLPEVIVNEDDKWFMDYSSVTALHNEAIKSVDNEVGELKEKLAKLESILINHGITF